MAGGTAVRSEVRRRILFVERTTGFGGSTVGLGHLLRGLDRRTTEPVVVVSHPTQRAWLERQGLGDVETHLVAMRPPRVAARPGNGLSAKLLRKLVDSPLAAMDSLSRSLPYERDLHEVVGGRRFDLFHLNNGVSVNRAGISVARRLGVPCVVKQRGFEWHSWDVARLAQQVDLYLPDSATVAADLAGLGVPRNRILVTYCAVDVPRQPVGAEARSAARAALGLPPDAPAIGIVGMLQDWKGQHVFLDAAASLLREFPDLRALVVGSTPSGADDPYAQDLRRRAASGDLAARVRFTGHRDDVPAVLAALDVVVHASTSPEPFGTIVAEAMAAGRPVVAAAAGGPAEYVEDGVTGFLHEPGDAGSLAEAIGRALRHPRAAARIAAAGREVVARRFGLPEHVRRTRAAYDAVLAGSGVRIPGDDDAGRATLR